MAPTRLERARECRLIGDGETEEEEEEEEKRWRGGGVEER